MAVNEVHPTHHDETIEAQRAKMSFIFREDVAPGLRLEMDLNQILFAGESDFQKIDVVDTYFGKTLVTDGKTQSSQMDEFAYHESLVHPPLLRAAFAGTPPKSVFIGGGGELATAREVLRHKTIERVVMLDIDGKVIEVCKKFLPEWGGEVVASDPRFELIIGDAYKWMMETDEMFDVVIMDISDPIEAGPGIMLYTKEFYDHVRTRLNPNGVFITQAGTADGIPASHQSDRTVDTSCYGPIHNTLRSVFDCVVPYSVPIPSYGGDWGFMMAFQAPAGTVDKALVEQEWKQPSNPNLIDELIEKQIEGGASKLGYYDSESHLGLFSLTKALRNLLKKDKRIMTRDNPVFMY